MFERENGKIAESNMATEGKIDVSSVFSGLAKIHRRAGIMTKYVLGGRFTVTIYIESWDKTTSIIMLRFERKCLKEDCCDVVNFAMAVYANFKNSACLRPLIAKVAALPSDTLEKYLSKSYRDSCEKCS
jgi:sulfur relay (sulfurtransferase) DsrC/TusE family protein